MKEEWEEECPSDGVIDSLINIAAGFLALLFMVALFGPCIVL